MVKSSQDAQRDQGIYELSGRTSSRQLSEPQDWML